MKEGRKKAGKEEDRKGKRDPELVIYTKLMWSNSKDIQGREMEKDRPREK